MIERYGPLANAISLFSKLIIFSNLQEKVGIQIANLKLHQNGLFEN